MRSPSDIASAAKNVQLGERAGELRVRLDGDTALPLAVRATIDAWCRGAPFGLALAGDAHRAERLFRLLRPYAGGIVRTADAAGPPPRAVRALALWADAVTRPRAVRRRCTAVVDVGAVIAPGRRPPGESEAQLWRRVVAALAAHGVRDGAIDVAACALASALVDAGYDGDPVALVRAWVAVPHGRALASAGAGEAGGTAPASADDEPSGSDAESPGGAPGGGADAETEKSLEEAPEAASAGAGPSGGGTDGGAEQPLDLVDEGATDAATGGDGDAAAGACDENVSDENATDARRADDTPAPDADADAAPAAKSPAPGGDRLPAPHPDDAGDAGAPDAGIATDAADALPAARAAALAVADLEDPPTRARVRSGRSARRGATRAGSGRGRPGRVVAPERAGGRIAMLPTLQHAVHRHAAAGARGEPAIGRDDLRGRLRAQPTATHTVVVVDGSSSMGGAGAAHARRVADVALGHAYRDRGDVSVILAAGSFARVVQERTPRVSRARAALQRASAEGGGGTPLADAVRRALDQLADAPRERCRLVIVSDGQATVDLAGRADPRTAARDLRVQLDRATARAGRTVFVPLDSRGWSPLERTVAPFRAAGVEVVGGGAGG